MLQGLLKSNSALNQKGLVYVYIKYRKWLVTVNISRSRISILQFTVQFF